MKTLPLFALLSLVLLTGGCGGKLDLTPEGNPSRVLTGTVNFNGDVSLPPDAVVVIRVVDPSHKSIPSPTAVLGEVTSKPPEMSEPPAVLGEQTIKNPGQPPIPFHLAYTAMDDQLRTGLNIEVRVAFGGRVRYSNLRGYGITLNNCSDSHTISVSSVDR